MTTRRHFKTSAGILTLGDELGRGGEAVVFTVLNHPDIAAKIYHKPMSSEKVAKLEAMISIKSEKLLGLTAWPTDLLWNDVGQPFGLLMPRLSSKYKDVHDLYGPKSRKVEFPNASWRFLIRAAANMARAFAIVHEAGCVIGDINHGGVKISDNATVKLIDCDSFQVSAKGRVFCCEVGVPDFTPPELQGKPFKGLIRSTNHDNFGLAVLIFRLLLMGRHPFAGRFLGNGEMPLEKAIAEFRFPYGSGKQAAQMDPPPHTPALATLSMPVALLFERAFSRNGAHSGRPDAREWVTALENLETKITVCRSNASHHYITGLKGCPWCQIETATGAVLFHATVVHGLTNHVGAFDIAAIWKKIIAIQPPGPSPALIDRQSLPSLQPNSDAIEAARRQRRQHMWQHIGLWMIWVSVIFLCINFPTGWLLWLIAGWIMHKNFTNEGNKNKLLKEFNDKFQSAEAHYRYIKEMWDRATTDQHFTAKLRELDSLRIQWQQLPNIRQERYKNLEKAREQLQLRRFLERIMIANAIIPGIGEGRKSMLASYNIETAWDITSVNLARVPGFGPVLTDKLVAWRRGEERNFRYNPAQGIDPRDIADLDREMTALKRKLEAQLNAGPSALLQIRNTIQTKRNTLINQVNDAFRDMIQAEIDLAAVKR